MIIKIEDRSEAHLRGLERFLRSSNWVHFPMELDVPTNPMTDIDKRDVEHAFAKILRKVHDKKRNGRFVVTLEISPYISDCGGCDIKVPASFLIGLMQSMDMFSDKFEHADPELF